MNFCSYRKKINCYSLLPITIVIDYQFHRLIRPCIFHKWDWNTLQCFKLYQKGPQIYSVANPHFYNIHLNRLSTCIFQKYVLVDNLHVGKVIEIQSNLQLRPPLLSDQFSKISKVSKSNHYIWNLLWATISLKRLRPLFELKVWTFPLLLTSCKQPLASRWNEKWIIGYCNIIVFLASSRDGNFSMRTGFYSWNWPLHE